MDCAVENHISIYNLPQNFFEDATVNIFNTDLCLRVIPTLHHSTGEHGFEDRTPGDQHILMSMEFYSVATWRSYFKADICWYFVIACTPPEFSLIANQPHVVQPWSVRTKKNMKNKIKNKSKTLQSIKKGYGKHNNNCSNTNFLDPFLAAWRLVYLPFHGCMDKKWQHQNADDKYILHDCIGCYDNFVRKLYSSD